MRKALILSILLLTTLVPAATAARDLCDIVCLSECNGGNACIIVRTSPDVCVGVGFGLQGVGTCVSPASGCVTVQYGFNRIPVCSYISLP